MRDVVKVNIYNTGKIFGITTPAYNIPMDPGTYQLLLEMGVNIELSENAIQKPQNIIVDATVVNDQSKRKKKKRVLLEVGDFVAKDVYSEEELWSMSKLELARILNFRGHYSAKTGKRDKLAPKYDDNKTILINKVMQTNSN